MSSTNLYRVPGTKTWAVKSYKNPDVTVFDSVEQAATFLETELSVKPDEVDEAIMVMYGQGHLRAEFGTNGYFTASFEDGLTEQFGVA